ncbi:hypothetical protein F5Y03DRAFT_395014 [Xylaria venustula]|nr:hypothetical protein F5Y03DRAFT_395014 [Xylaria venustula]
MSSGEGNSDQARGFDYGASVTEEHVDFGEDASIGSAGGRDRALIDKLKDALKPGDAKKTTGDTTHDGRHGGVEQVMQPGQRDYDESAHGSSILDKAGFGSGKIKHKIDDNAGGNEMHRDSSHLDKADESLVPGNMYRSIRDGFLQ